jgi:uncharacterized membrane protein (DUF485 family)
MSSVIYERIRRNPKFDELVQKRGSFAWTLSAIVLILFYGFFLLVAFNPEDCSVNRSPRVRCGPSATPSRW